MPSRRLIQAVKSPEPETFRKRFLEISITVARRQGPELTHQGCPGSGFGALPRKALVRRGVEGGTLGRASLGHGTDDEPAHDRYEARPRGAFSFTAAATDIALSWRSELKRSQASARAQRL